MAAVNLLRIPNITNWLNFSFQKIKNEIEAMFSVQQTAIIEALDTKHTGLLDNIRSIVSNHTTTLQDIEKACTTSTIPLNKSKMSTALSDVLKTNLSTNATNKTSTTNSWADVDGFQLVQKVKKKENNHPGNPAVDQNPLVESTAFKIILPISQLFKFTNPDIWPQYTFLREWDFSLTSHRRTAEDKVVQSKIENHGGAK
ncbi:hypothetical protein HELRODRAFT_162054 [Helobdella robusta]|uniref:Uncharacterized protein n=1 Tax=Helobdella robusta TaxID=6412 RepID=T1ES71_HELRO|nr:hypothetical protein HELRODRAFT_162054 [Helobdella robusta]ESN98618.1 hypothetical protein HELRODRAFT_162054 [Helobdella robusta]